MGLAILMGFITILSSKHLHDSVSIRFFLQGELFFKYFALLYVYWAFSSEDSIKPTLKITFVGFALYLLFYISIIISFFRNRKYSMVATAFGISVVCTY